MLLNKRPKRWILGILAKCVDRILNMLERTWTFLNFNQNGARVSTIKKMAKTFRKFQPIWDVPKDLQVIPSKSPECHETTDLSNSNVSFPAETANQFPMKSPKLQKNEKKKKTHTKIADQFEIASHFKKLRQITNRTLEVTGQKHAAVKANFNNQRVDVNELPNIWLMPIEIL